MTAIDRLNRLLARMTDIFDVAIVEVMALRVVGTALILLAVFWIARVVRASIEAHVLKHELEDDKTRRLRTPPTNVIQSGMPCY